MSTPQGSYYNSPQRSSTYNDYPPHHYNQSPAGFIRGGGFRSPTRSFSSSSSNPYAQQYDAPATDPRGPPPPRVPGPFTGVMKDPNAPGGQAWAEYYANGGTDPAGLVYFYPETVQGFPYGPQHPPAPAPQSYSSQHPQAQHTYAQPALHVLPSGPPQNVYTSQPSVAHHNHSQSVPAAYPYQHPARHPSYGNTIQSSPSPHAYVQPLPPVHNVAPPQVDYRNPIDGTAGGHATTQSPSIPSPTRTPSTSSRPLPQPRVHFQAPPPSSSNAFAVPQSSFPPTAPIRPTSSSVPRVGTYPTSSFAPTSPLPHAPSLPEIGSAPPPNGIPKSSSLRSIASTSSATSVSSATGGAGRPLPTPSGPTPALVLPQNAAIPRQTAQEAFAAVQARRAGAGVPALPPPPAGRDVLAPAAVAADVPPLSPTASVGSRATPLPQPGVVRVPGERPLPAPMKPSSDDQSRAPAEPAPRSPPPEQSVPAEPLPRSSYRPLPTPQPKPQPKGLTEEEKRAEYRSEAQRRMQEKMKSFGRLRRTDSTTVAQEPKGLISVVETTGGAPAETSDVQLNGKAKEELHHLDQPSPDVHSPSPVGTSSPSRLPAVTKGRPLPPRRTAGAHSRVAEAQPVTLSPASPMADEVETLQESVQSQVPSRTNPLPERPVTVRSPSAFGARSPSAFGSARPPSLSGSLASRSSVPTTPPLPSPLSPSSSYPPIHSFTSGSSTSPPASGGMGYGNLAPEDRPSRLVTSTPSTPGLTDTGETSSATSVGSSEVDLLGDEDTEEEDDHDTPGPARQVTPPPQVMRSPPETPRAPARQRPHQQEPQSMALRMATMSLQEERDQRRGSHRTSQSVDKPPAATSIGASSSTSPPSSYPSEPPPVASSSRTNTNGIDRTTQLRSGSSNGIRKVAPILDLDDTPPRPLRGNTPLVSAPDSGRRTTTPSRSSGSSSRPLPSRPPLPMQMVRSPPPIFDLPVEPSNPTRQPSAPPAPAKAPPPPSASRRVAPSPTSVPVINFPDEDDDEDPVVPSASAPSFKLSRSPSITISVSEEPPTPSSISSASSSRQNGSGPLTQAATSGSRPPGSPVVQRKGTLRCAGCDGMIVGRIVSAMGRRWHPACFKCSQCDELLEHVSSYEHEGKAYCHLDYHELFAPRCFHCQTSIADERFITVSDPALSGGETRFYHELHFFCAECGDPFLHPSASSAAPKGQQPGLHEDTANDLGYTIYRGHPYCEACHVRLRMPKCAGCKKSIRDEVVEALDQKWHFHCFACATCKRPFEDPSFFQRGDLAYCDECYAILVKNEI